MRKGLPSAPVEPGPRPRRPSGAVASWFRVPAVLCVLAPVAAPLYGVHEPFRHVLVALTLVGLTSSAVWFARSDGGVRRIGLGALLLWYALFSAPMLLGALP